MVVWTLLSFEHGLKYNINEFVLEGRKSSLDASRC